MDKEEDKPFILGSEEYKLKHCKERSIAVKRMFKANSKPKGYFVSEVTELIRKLRAECYSTDTEILREEAIRRCSREF